MAGWVAKTRSFTGKRELIAKGSEQPLQPASHRHAKQGLASQRLAKAASMHQCEGRPCRGLNSQHLLITTPAKAPTVAADKSKGCDVPEHQTAGAMLNAQGSFLNTSAY